MNKKNIDLINNYLKEGKTVEEIRKIFYMGEKKFQLDIKASGYKYNQKLRQYTKIDFSNIGITKSNALSSVNNDALNKIRSNSKSSVSCNTEESNIKTTNSNTICNTEDRSLLFIKDNIDLLEEMLLNYKHHKECSINNYGIVIDLIDDKHKGNDKPKSIRVNYFVWEEWKEFTKNNNYNSKELVSMALKEYMEKYKQQK